MPTKNLRRDPRVGIRVPVELVRGRAALPAEARDVSYRGLFVATAAPPPLRSLVRLRVALPQRTLEVHAMVVHVTDEGAGLQLWAVSGVDRADWDAFVRELLHPAHHDDVSPSGIRAAAHAGAPADRSAAKR